MSPAAFETLRVIFTILILHVFSTDTRKKVASRNFFLLTATRNGENMRAMKTKSKRKQVAIWPSTHNEIEQMRRKLREDLRPVPSVPEIVNNAICKGLPSIMAENSKPQ